MLGLSGLSGSNVRNFLFHSRKMRQLLSEQ